MWDEDLIKKNVDEEDIFFWWEDEEDIINSKDKYFYGQSSHNHFPT